MTLLLDSLMPENYKTIAQYLDTWIVLTDKIMDREIKAEYAIDAFDCGLKSFEQIIKINGLFESIYPHINILSMGARADLNYIPGQLDKQEDLEIWKLKAGRASVEFAILCHYDNSFDTKENWDWIVKVQEAGLINNDCDDIIDKRFEDIIQHRRNYVLLTRFEKDIFETWRDRIEDLTTEALAVRKMLTIPTVADQRLDKIYELAKEVLC